jgi:hypothetical protein
MNDGGCEAITLEFELHPSRTISNAEDKSIFNS